MILLAVLALLLALAALAVSVQVWRSLRTRERHQAVAGEDLPLDVRALREEVAALRLDNQSSLRNIAVVRYDAFGDMGGHLSWSMALLDDHGNGTLLTSIHGRNDARTYAKSVAGWRSDQELSPEEEDALGQARP